MDDEELARRCEQELQDGRTKEKPEPSNIFIGDLGREVVQRYIAQARAEGKAEEAEKWATLTCSAHLVPDSECSVCNIKFTWIENIEHHKRVAKADGYRLGQERMREQASAAASANPVGIHTETGRPAFDMADAVHRIRALPIEPLPEDKP